MALIYQRIDAKRPADLWEFHGSGDRRELLNVFAFCAYAASPSTEEVVFVEPTPEDPEAQFVARGPKNALAWFTLSPPYHPNDVANLNLLMHEARLKGKLKRG